MRRRALFEIRGSRLRRALDVALVLVSLGTASVARAQQQPEPPPSDIPNVGAVPRGGSGAAIVPPKEEPPAPAPTHTLKPPSVKSDPGALYPQAALSEGMAQQVTVTLVLTIDAEGHVTGARVETPQGHGFDEAALEAARGLVFEPATRDGAPIPAKWKHVYVFNPPPGRLTGRLLATQTGAPLADAKIVVRAPDGSERTTTTEANGKWTVDGLPGGTYHVTATAAGFKPASFDEPLHYGEEARLVYRVDPEVAPSPAGEEEAEEITVRGQRPPREAVVHSIDQRELSRIPGTNGDALRGLLNMPGVAQPPAFAGLLVVRGSAPQDTQVFVDGTLVPLVYHFGGLSSVVPTEMIDRIDFYPGNYSAQYGRGMGGLVDVGLRSPKSDSLHGLAQVDLIDARVMAEGPIGSTGWKFAVAGRRSWVDVWLKPVLEKADAGVTTAPVYYDYQAVAERTWDKHRQSLRFALFGSDDRLDILLKNVNTSDPTLGGGVSAHTGFWRGQVRYENKISPETSLRLVGAVGEDFVDFAVGDLYFKITTYPISGRLELAQKLMTDATMNVGLDMYYSPYTANVRVPPPNPPGQPPPGPVLARPPLTISDTDQLYRPAFYDELELTPWPGARLVPGLRLDYSKDTKSWDLAPRMVARQDVIRGFPKTTLKAAAGIYYQPPQPQETNPVFGQIGLKSNRATEYDVGIEQDITRNVDLKMDAFYKQLDNLVTTGFYNEGTGRSYGLETLLRWKPDARFFGWLAYTLSRSVRKDTPDLPERMNPFDQTHILTVLGSYRLGRGWEIGARFRLVSGSLYTPRAYGFYDENNATYLSLNQYPPNGSRFPIFHQLDIRVDKVWRYTHWQLSAYLDVQNVYNQGNVAGVSTNYNQTQQTYATGLPILPSLGIRAEF
jgi:TonB family protein